MLRSWISRLAKLARADAWWIFPQLIVVIALSATLGMWGVWSIYAAINTGLVWLYADHQGPRKLRRQKLFKLLAIPLLPVGFVSVVTTGGGGPTISDQTGRGSPDDEIRKASAKDVRVGRGGTL